jgi:hypothetical protein
MQFVWFEDRLAFQQRPEFVIRTYGEHLLDRCTVDIGHCK